MRKNGQSFVLQADVSLLAVGSDDKRGTKDMLRCYYMDISIDCAWDQMDRLYNIIPKERAEKIDKIRNNVKATKHLLSNAFLQYGLSEALKIPMEEITYIYGEYGKPGIVYNGKDMRQQVDFNLSHSGSYAVLAVSDRLVGIDVERLKKDRMAVAERFFCREEYEDILKVDGLEREIRFLEYWTMKEAYVKRIGNGLHTPLDSFLISRGSEGVSVVEQEEVYFSTFFLKEQGYCVSVCSEYKDKMGQLSKDVMQEVKLNQIMEK